LTLPPCFLINSPLEKAYLKKSIQTSELNSKNKKIKTNPDKQLLACDQIVTFDKKGKENNLTFGQLEPEPVIRFGGFALEEPWLDKQGKTRQLGLQLYYLNSEEFSKIFSLNNLGRVLAHELAHTILTDLDPASQRVNEGHGVKHDEYTQKFLDLILNSEEYQELKKY
ncbi:27_t:CDS:2, partial [Gigaspora margarita]